MITLSLIRRMAATALFIALGSAGAQAQMRTFICPNNTAVTITDTGPDSVSVAPIEGRIMAMRKSGDGLRFANGEYDLEITPDQNRASFMIPDFGPVECTFQPGVSADGRAGIGNPAPLGEQPQQRNNAPSRPQQQAAIPNDLPMTGRSLGGVMRSGPAQESARVRSMAENEALTIMARGPMWNGYNWFRIVVGSQPGWQWGGIMCSTAQLDGIYETCKR